MPNINKLLEAFQSVSDDFRQHCADFDEKIVSTETSEGLHWGNWRKRLNAVPVVRSVALRWLWVGAGRVGFLIDAIGAFLGDYGDFRVFPSVGFANFRIVFENEPDTQKLRKLLDILTPSGVGYDLVLSNDSPFTFDKIGFDTGKLGETL